MKLEQERKEKLEERLEWKRKPTGEEGKETSKAAVNCYGIKPRTQDEDHQLHKWNVLF